MDKTQINYKSVFQDNFKQFKNNKHKFNFLKPR